MLEQYVGDGGCGLENLLFLGCIWIATSREQLHNGCMKYRAQYEKKILSENALHWKNGDSAPGIWLERCLKALALSSRGSLSQDSSCPEIPVGVTVADEELAPLVAMVSSLDDGSPGACKEDNKAFPSSSDSFSGI
jgi:hypothetical protein